MRINHSLFFILFFGLSVTVSAQDSLKVKVDSLLSTQELSQRLKPADSTTAKAAGAKLTVGQIIGLRKPEPEQRPKAAFLRSLLLPGTGQITNRQYWKVPLIYTAAGVSIVYIRRMNIRYNDYLGYLQEMKDTNTSEIMIGGKGPYSKEGVTSAANTARRYRDLNIIGFAAGWLIFAVEANVAAHLKTFDMNEDISLKISPSIQSGPMHAAIGLKLDFNIK